MTLWWKINGRRIYKMYTHHRSNDGDECWGNSNSDTNRLVRLTYWTQLGYNTVRFLISMLSYYASRCATNKNVARATETKCRPIYCIERNNQLLPSIVPDSGESSLSQETFYAVNLESPIICGLAFSSIFSLLSSKFQFQIAFIHYFQLGLCPVSFVLQISLCRPNCTSRLLSPIVSQYFHEL